MHTVHLHTGTQDFYFTVGTGSDRVVASHFVFRS